MEMGSIDIEIDHVTQQSLGRYVTSGDYYVVISPSWARHLRGVASVGQSPRRFSVDKNNRAVLQYCIHRQTIHNCHYTHYG